LPRSMRSRAIPALSHCTDSRDRPAVPAEAKGSPLSVRIARGQP
jgi:hypothetical protein